MALEVCPSTIWLRKLPSLLRAQSHLSSKVEGSPLALSSEPLSPGPQSQHHHPISASLTGCPQPQWDRGSTTSSSWAKQDVWTSAIIILGKYLVLPSGGADPAWEHKWLCWFTEASVFPGEPQVKQGKGRLKGACAAACS